MELKAAQTMDSMAEERFFLGRQPILDRDQRIFGFELLFRAADSLTADVVDYGLASASVILSSLECFGFQAVLGKYKGFFNVNLDVLMDDALELLPREQVVVELLEFIEASEEVVARCLELKEKGFTLALDDHLFSEAYAPLYELVDIVKIDILAVPPEDVAEMVRQLRRWPVTLLAEKVETHEVFQRCHELGFDLFQGYHFARPVVLKQRKVDVSGVTLMKLFNQVSRDVEVREIEETFRENPGLTYNLLRLVNSVGMGLREKIKTLRHAIVVLGRTQLLRWVQLALFAAKGPRGGHSPLLEIAAARGRFMELLVQKSRRGNDGEFADLAFMTGILSLLDALFEAPMEEVIGQLNLADEVRRALVGRDGELGGFLQIAEFLEQNNFPAAAQAMAPLRVSAEAVSAAQLESIRWTNGLLDYL